MIKKVCDIFLLDLDDHIVGVDREDEVDRDGKIEHNKESLKNTHKSDPWL